jgi:hypothetical protein
MERGTDRTFRNEESMIVQGSLGKYLGMALVAILSLALCKPALAQTPSAEPAKKAFTLEQAVDFALKNYPEGELDGKSIEVIGGLREGDEIAARGTDELRPGTHVVTKQIPAETQTRK